MVLKRHCTYLQLPFISCSAWSFQPFNECFFWGSFTLFIVIIVWAMANLSLSLWLYDTMNRYSIFLYFRLCIYNKALLPTLSGKEKLQLWLCWFHFFLFHLPFGRATFVLLPSLTDLSTWRQLPGFFHTLVLSVVVPQLAFTWAEMESSPVWVSSFLAFLCS